MIGVQKIIDRVFFDKPRRFFMVQLIVYTIGFVAPFLVAEFSSNDVMATALTIPSITLLMFAVIEFMDMYKNGIAYFRSGWNYIDITLIIGWYTYYILKWKDGFKHETGQTEYSDAIIGFNLIKITVAFLSFMKVISFCRVFEGFASLIMML